LPFHIGATVPTEGDERIPIQEEGVMSCEVREKIFRANNQKITLAVTAYRNGNGKVILLASSIHRRLAIDFVTTTEKFGELLISTWRCR